MQGYLNQKVGSKMAENLFNATPLDQPDLKVMESHSYVICGKESLRSSAFFALLILECVDIDQICAEHDSLCCGSKGTRSISCTRDPSTNTTQLRQFMRGMLDPSLPTMLED
jgi:hypothetical protein